MKRRSFSLSLLSAISLLPVAIRKLFASPGSTAYIGEAEWLASRSTSQVEPLSAVTLLPIGFAEDSFVVAAVSEDGTVITRNMSFNLSPQLGLDVEVPKFRGGTFAAAEGPFRLVEATADFGEEIGVLPYKSLTIDPSRAWTAKILRVDAAGEHITVRTVNGEDVPILVTEWPGSSQLDFQLSPLIRRILLRNGVDPDRLGERAMLPNARQRMLQTSGGEVAFNTPDPPLDPDKVEALGTLDITIWSPVSITVPEREG